MMGDKCLLRSLQNLNRGYKQIYFLKSSITTKMETEYVTSKLAEGGKNQNEEKKTMTKNQHKRRQEKIKEDFF